MKNLLTFTDPLKRFVKDCEILTKMQIDNSLELGWKREDIVLATNFPYEYKGIKSIIIGTHETFDNNRSAKIAVINDLFDLGVIKDEVFWFHDDDAFQLIPFELELDTDSAFTVYRDPPVWNAGSFFFKESARDIFKDIWRYMHERGTNEQDALTYMWHNNINNINERHILLNITYNLGVYNIKNKMKDVDLPVKVAHFHPNKKHHLDLYRDFLPERLMKIFNQYGIE